VSKTLLVGDKEGLLPVVTHAHILKILFWGLSVQWLGKSGQLNKIECDKQINKMSVYIVHHCEENP